MSERVICLSNSRTALKHVLSGAYTCESLKRRCCSRDGYGSLW